MDKNYQLLGAAESHYKSLLDRYSLLISDLMTKGDTASLDKLVDTIGEYTYTLNQYNFLQRMKVQGKETKEENEN
jgi:hypothetical protein|tara:strand:+ start:104 stop:328 length:225 start_codon:yes stop_codon:yes gene_type:complete